MAKTKISEYDALSSNNTDVDSINIAEGCAPSGINNAIREVMAHLKDFQQGTNGDPFNGPVNGTVGATTPSTGAFTTLSASGAVTLSGGTANGVTYLNGSKVVTSGSALTFDGSNFVVNPTNTQFYVGSSFAKIENKAGASASFIMSDTTDGATIKNIGSSIAFINSSSEGMRLTSTGLGIGTSSINATYAPRLQVESAANDGTGGLLIGSYLPTLTLIDYSGGAGASQIQQDGTNFLIKNGGTERARIDSSGRLGIGYSSPTAQLVVGGTGAGGWYVGSRNALQLRNSNSSGNQSNYIGFGSAGTPTHCSILNDINADGTTVNQLNIYAGASGGVYLANGGTSWSSASDERLKDIIEPITNAVTKVGSLRSVIGKYKTDDQDKRRAFLIAQDVLAVLPEAVTIGTDKDKTLGLAYTDLVPLLVAAIQEQQTIISSLTARIEALEAK